MPMRREQVAAALRYLGDKADLRRRAERMVSLDPQEQDLADIAVETGASFVPGVGQALAARDVERARRANDPAGMAMAAAGAIPGGKLAKLLKGFDPTRLELDVYHGTPHRFPATEANPLGEFDASKIGTGEGAQAYGHGIYLAESPDVARGYQEKLTPAAGWAYDNVSAGALDKKTRVAVTQLSMEMNNLGTRNGWPDIETARRMAEMKLRKTGEPEAAELIAKIDPEKIKEPSGAFYTADLPDEMVDRMLDWDKPLSEQPEFVQKAWADWRNSPQAQKLVKQMGSRGFSAQDLEKTFGNPTGAAMHKWIYEGFGSSKGGEMPKVAQFLKDKGLVGVKYQDAGSRGQGGSGTRNFVVFPGEEKKVRILERK